MASSYSKFLCLSMLPLLLYNQGIWLGELLEGTWFLLSPHPLPRLASCLTGSGGSAEWTDEWKKGQWESEQTQNSHLALPELICFAGREYGCVPDPVLGYIPSAANKKHIKNHMQRESNRSDFSYIQTRVNSPSQMPWLFPDQQEKSS